MRRATEEYLKNPDPSIGGATIPLIGKPGSGKTKSVIRITEKHLENDHIIVTRGTKQCQWTHYLANDIPVTLWIHESINNVEAYIQGSKKDDISRKEIDLENHVKIERFDTAEKLVENAEHGRANVVIVPGLDGNEDHQMYFFRYFWVKLMEAMIGRNYGDFITLVLDEIGDIFPSQQQLRKPFYSLVRDLPPKLAQLRKNNVWLLCAAHGTHDMHYYIWKIKSNTIAYMTGAIVKNELSPQVNQKGVNGLDRGHIMMPGPDKSLFKEPTDMRTLSWIPDSDIRKFRMNWDADIPNLLEKEEEEEGKSEMELKKELAKDLYEMSELDLTQAQIGGMLDISQKTVSDVT